VGRVRIWQDVREQLDPTVINSFDGAIDCDISVFSRLCQLSERVQWIDHIVDSNKYSVMFQKCNSHLGYFHRSEETFNPVRRLDNDFTDVNREKLTLVNKIPLKADCKVPSYNSIKIDIKNTFARLACGSQVYRTHL